MKKNKQKTDAINTRVPQFGRLTLLVGALVATGVLSPLSLPEAMAAPLPVPCGGCVNNSHVVVPFLQAGTLANLDPITGLPVANGTNLTINQTSQVAILNWQSFNIDPGYSVNFVQPNSTSSALNRIWDSNPTTIAGSLTANGQIYLVNQNGIVFANGAQVNTNTLIATSLDITDQLFTDGYFTNTRVIPAFSGVGGFVKVETGAKLNGSLIMMFAPVVENNGSISTPGGQTVLAAGNKVYLEASQDPNLVGVLVEVDINDPGKPRLVDGIDTLAGYGLQYTEAGVVTNAGDIITQRGNTTLVGFAVNQQGRISATTSVTENGSIKLLARYGVAAESDTTKNAALSDKYGFPVYDIRATQTGKVTLAKDSVTAITPQEIFDPQQNKWVADTATITGDQTFKKSIVEVMGSTINMQSGSKIIVPGGQVTLAAISSYVPYVAPVAEIAATADTPAVPAVLEVLASGLIPGSTSDTPNNPYQAVFSKIDHSSFLNPNYKPASASNDTARVFMDSGSLIDVSGSSANVSVARNILTVQLRGSQLADSPVQRTDRFLWGKDVLIDIRQGTPLANYAADEAGIGRTAAELTSAGGTVKLISTGDVVMKSGATVNLSGGQINYTGANIKTTTLVSEGVVYDIANASPDRIYTGISNTYKVDHKKWGISETFSTMAGGDSRGRWDAGYVEGKSAGTLTILAPHAVIDGEIIAKTVVGDYQREAFDLSKSLYKDTWKMMAQGGTLVIGENDIVGTSTGGPTVYNYINNSNVVIQSGAPKLANDFTLFSALPTGSQQNIVLDSSIFGSSNGLNNLAIYSNKTVSVAAGTTVKLAAGGSITLKGDTVNMLGAIDAPAGTVNLSTAVTSSSVNQIAGALNVGAPGSSSYISTRGQWVNDSTLFGVPDWSKPLTTNGGSINLNSGSDLLLAAGTKLDASGGAWLDTNNKLHGGNGGDITLKSGKLAGVAFKTQLKDVDLRSYGTAGGKGGSLTIAANDIILGGAANAETTLALTGVFFQNGGFNSYDLTAQNGNMTVAAGTVIEPIAQSLILDRTTSRQASGSDVYTFASVGLLPEWQRKATSITLSAESGGSLRVEEGAVIRVEPTANIKLSASNQLTVLGTLDARAGNINLSLSNLSDYIATQSIWLGSESKLLSQGYFEQSQPNTQNLLQGKVLSGGKITISANTGYVVAQKGSTMDVSGASADIDLPQLQSGSLVYRRSHVAGDAGSINVKTSEGGFFDGSMNAGVEAGSQAAAGKFSLTLNNSKGFSGVTTGFFPKIPAQIMVMESGNGNFASQAGLKLDVDQKPGEGSLDALAGNVWLDASALKKSGFDQVELKSDYAINLADKVDLQTRRSITLDAPQLLVTGNSKITSAHVTIGNLDQLNQALLNPLDSQLKLNPVAGNGTLDVSAQLVDLKGNFIVSGVKQLNIDSSGDIRLNGVYDTTKLEYAGSLRTQGNVSLTADQVYPTTMAKFTVAVEDGTFNPDGAPNPGGKITILPGQHGASPVLSAGGQLTLSAAEIEQNGVVKAPMGTLILDGSTSLTLGEGSLTSVSADGLTIPFGLIDGGKDWTYNGVIVAAPPEKQVKLTSPNTDVKNGAIVNLAGGGDLYAYEFFAGSGGSVNVLDPSKAPANTFAIIPGLSGYSPYDPQITDEYARTGDNASKTMLQSGASVYLAGGADLKAGYYTLLPASYALLPGAYKITAVSGYSDRQPGQGVTTLTDGSQIMAGKFAVVGTDIQDARYSGFRVTSGAVVRTQAEYHDSYANQFFTDLAMSKDTQVPHLAKDAGQLIISATGANATLIFDGMIKADIGAGGQGALVDLNGPGFDIVNAKGAAPVYSADGKVELVQLTTSSLNNLGANSLLIGGVRTLSAAGMEISVGASDVLVDNRGSVLSAPEIILAATNAVTIKAGSVIEGKGTFTGKASDINIGAAGVSGDGALLRVSSSEQVTVKRINSPGLVGTLKIEDGATVSALNSVLFDASHVTNIGGSAILDGKALSVAANAIDIGNGSSGATSLGLTAALLSQMKGFQDITLHSYNDINFYGQATLGSQDTQGKHLISNLVLNAKSLNGIDSAGKIASIDAGSVTLMNNNGAVVTAAPNGSGKLAISADKIVLAEGAKNIRGFDTVEFNAAQQITGQGKGDLTLASSGTNARSLVLQGTLTGTSKSDQTISASTYDTTIKAPTKAIEANGDIGAKLAINAKSILDQGSIDLAAGTLSLHATDDITLDSTSRTSAAGAMKIIGGQVAYAPAGSITLISDNGGVNIKSLAEVDVSGAAAGGDAGSINIAAANGAVSVAGTLKGVAAANYAQGSFTLDGKSLTGTINPLTGITNNALTELNNTLTAGSFTTLRDIRIRTGNLVLDADEAGSVRAQAQTFHLAADAGSIDVIGKIDSSGVKGGDILLAAKNNLTLHSENDSTLNTVALLDASASATDQQGGKVTLETTAGKINLNNRRIDVHGSKTGGRILLRAPQISNIAGVSNSEVALDNTGGSALNVNKGANVTVEAFRTYNYTGATSLNEGNTTTTTDVYRKDAEAFAGNAYAIKQRLGMLGDNNLHLTPGVELNVADDPINATNKGNLNFYRKLDLSSWRFNDGNGANTEAGIFTIQAAGDLKFVEEVLQRSVTTQPGKVGQKLGTTIVTTYNFPLGITTTVTTVTAKNTGNTTTDTITTVDTITPSLTDGVTTMTSDGTVSGTNNIFSINANGKQNPTVTPMSGPSWSYRLVSGADLTGADVMAVNNKKTGDFTLSAGKEVTTTTPAKTTYTMQQISTGTGFVDIAAGGSFNLNSKYSVIYTFGQPKVDVPVTGANASNKYFGADGGDISILAKGDVNGAATDQLVTDWQWREGLPNVDGTIKTQPAWWINLQSFRQNIGALGGGNVRVTAGGNINTLSAVTPTTGYVDMVDPAHPAVVLGGGNLSVNAGGNINSGVFYVGNGQGSVRAGGSLGTNRKDKDGKNLYTVLALGQGNFDVRAGGDLNLQTVLNPTMISQGTSQFPGATNVNSRSYFFTYGDSSGVSLSSLSGDVVFQNNIDFYKSTTARTIAGTSADGLIETGKGFFRIPNDSAVAYFGATTVYASTLKVSALGGSIISSSASTLFPSVTGNLQLIADKNIQLGPGSLGFVMSDADTHNFNANTVTVADPTIDKLPISTSLITSLNNGHSAIHADDTQPVIISAGGSISGIVTLPKSAQIEAGQDVYNFGLTVQNLKNTDTTSIVAGRDIAYVYVSKDPTVLTPGITVNGPGQLVLQAGRNVDLGRSDGVVTKGNLNNYLLPEQGADITVLAGVGKGATATQAFIDKYIDPAATGTIYGDELISYVGKYSDKKDQTATQAFATFSDWSKNGLDKPLQDAFVRQVFFSELKQAGRNASNVGNYQAGYDAIATLYPSRGYKGDISLYSSQIKTERGGDINIFTPGGGVNAGLANGSTKAATELGIVTIKGGDVNAFVNDDFLVNQSRVFTLQGGNILMWSSNGDIDAGKGSKTASATPPPLLVVDPKTGTFKVDVTGSVAGSGIRVLQANKDVKAGSVDLYAPAGEINAGDAGIGAAGNIYLGALVVRGADNINFGGTSAGVPVAAPAPVSVGLSLQDASKVANEATQSLASVSDMSAKDFKPTFLSVEVIGMGEEESKL